MRSIVAAVLVRLTALALLGLAFLLAWPDAGWIRRPWSQHRARPERPASASRASADWPHRRGPGYNAVSAETGLADSWPPEGPPILWMRPLGRGYSGFSVVGSLAFTQTQSLTAQYVVCLDAETGEAVWQHRYAWPYEPGGMYPGPRATPTWHDGRVYFAGPDGLVGCLQADNGKPLWQVNVHEKFSGRGTGFGYACSPLVEDGLVILPVGGAGASVVALSAQDGSTVWVGGDEPASYCSALPITFRGRRCVAALLQNVLVIFDLKTGRLLSTAIESRGYDEHAAAPLYDEPLLIIARPFRGGAECVRLEADESAGDGPPPLRLKTVWQSRELSNDTASSVLHDGHVFGFDLRDVQAKAHRPSRGRFKCLDFATGEVLWSTDRVGHATVLVADGKLILFNDKGELILARASSERYQELARTTVFGGEICWTAPALAHGRLYLRSPTRAACVYLGRPELLNARQRSAARPASETGSSGRLDLVWLVGGEREYAFDPAGPKELWRWFAYSLVGVLGVATMLAAAVRLLTRRKWPAAAPRLGGAVFWTAAFVLGVAGTPVFNRWAGPFILTWPVCLFVAHQVALNSVVRSGRPTELGRSPWTSMLAACFFIVVCLGYFLVCRRLSLATEWAFLAGFVPAWPIAIPAAYRLRHNDRPWANLAWTLAAFSVYFWSVGAYLIWRAHVV